MQKVFQGFIDVDNIFWGDDIFRWWFYIAIVLIIIFEKRKNTKISFAWFSIIFLIGLFNPVSNWIMSILAPMWQYRARLYAMLPIPYVLSLGSILLINFACGNRKKDLSRLNNKDSNFISGIKLCIVFGVCISIFLGGTDVYQQDWMKPAQNLEKVPQAVLELREKLRTKKNLCIAVPDSLSPYIRQVAPEFFTPYTRYVDELGEMLSQDNPDPMDVLNMAGKESADYIVVKNCKETCESFNKLGYEPYERITGYLIYKVEGVPFTQRTYNEKRQIVREVFLDEKGTCVENEYGYAGKAYEYDDDGNCNKEIYLGTDGNAKKIDSGYAAIVKSYTRFGRWIASIMYLDENFQPMLRDGRYETRYKYGKGVRLEVESYYDKDGLPMNRVDDSFASRELLYDNNNQFIGERYYDTKGNPTLCSLGYASYIRDVDSNGKIIKEYYYGLDGNPIQIGMGYSGIIRVISEKGLVASETYLDDKKNPIKIELGYAQVKWEYNAANLIVQESYWDTEGNLTLCKQGYAQIVLEYNELGKLVRESYRDTEGNLTLCKQGYAQIVLEYNELGKIVNELYFDKYGEQVER